MSTEDMLDHRLCVGDRVQYWDEDYEEMLVGEIKSLRSSEEDGETLTFATVLLDDDEEPVEYDVADLEAEGTEDELEAEFRKVAGAHMDEIEVQLKIAADAIAKAEELSEKYGLPFDADVSPLGQSYFPSTFPEKFGELNSGFVTKITGAWSEYFGEGAGWEHSAVC